VMLSAGEYKHDLEIQYATCMPHTYELTFHVGCLRSPLVVHLKSTNFGPPSHWLWVSSLLECGCSRDILI
jgi:hypothetical protein